MLFFEVQLMSSNSGMRYEFLPPYSPDFNPIELAFSSIKAYIRHSGGIVREAMGQSDNTEVFLRLHEAVYSVTENDAKGYYRHCGYSI